MMIGEMLVCLEELLSSGDFEAVDAYLNTTDVDNLTPAMMLAALSITRPAADKLEHREDFISRVETNLSKALGDARTERLLQSRR